MTFLTAKDVSIQLRIPLARVYELTRRGRIPVVRLGERQYRYDQEALSEWSRRGGMGEINAAAETGGVRCNVRR